MYFITSLYYNPYVFEPFGHELCTKTNTNALKSVFHMMYFISLFKFSIICSLISTHDHQNI
jgi:hypothetical protein